MNINRTRTLSGTKAFDYNDIINYIKYQNKNKTRNEIIYQKIIQEGTKQHTIAAEIQWKKQLPKINFKKIWKKTYISCGQLITKYLHCRLLHYSTKSNMSMLKCSRDYNTNCQYCRLTEDNLHLFIHCTRMKKCGNITKQYLTN